MADRASAESHVRQTDLGSRQTDARILQGEAPTMMP